LIFICSGIKQNINNIVLLWIETSFNLTALFPNKWHYENRVDRDMDTSQAILLYCIWLQDKDIDCQYDCKKLTNKDNQRFALPDLATLHLYH